MINARFNSAIRTGWQNRVMRHFLYWLLAFLLLYFSVCIYESHQTALMIASAIIVPGPIPVYLHLIALKHLFEKRRYLIYFAALVMIVVASGILIERVFLLIMGDPDSHISGIGVALFYIIFTTGFQFYSQGLKQTDYQGIPPHY